MTVNEIRQKYLDFFKEKGHTVIPSASLLPENDPTVLFTTAGMHPLVPFLMGEKHPSGSRLTNAQKCLRTDDIDEVGDNRHLTFFEMLGNWSLGDYFKKETIEWAFDFLTEKQWLGLDPSRLYVTVFEGDSDAPRDEESIWIWQAQFEVKGIAAELGEAGKDEPTKENTGPRIYAYPKDKNWWGPPGITGPCGPDTEIFYDTGREHDPTFGKLCHPNCDCGRFVEIWNNVFMEYFKDDEGAFQPLKQKNVDTGMGLERIAAVLQDVPTVFDTEIFRNLFAKIETLSGKTYGEIPDIDRSFRIIADHIRAATFVIGDQKGIGPSNVGQGYIVRRLIRRAIREAGRVGIKEPFTHLIAEAVVGEFGAHYGELEEHMERIVSELKAEEEKFAHTLEKGMKELEKILHGGELTAQDAFTLFSTYGFPIELTEEILREHGKSVDHEEFEREFKKHQELSRSASAGAFKGGLADDSEETTRLHTATHLLHRALKNVLGDHVEQKGSNITKERLRFDFSHQEKMTPEQIKEVEDQINEVIEKDLPVSYKELTMEEAKVQGAIGYFDDKYAQLGNKIKVYFVGNDEQGFYSKEICGGPHVKRTGELGSFKIKKEQSASAGVRRIKAIVGANE